MIQRLGEWTGRCNLLGTIPIRAIPGDAAASHKPGRRTSAGAGEGVGSTPPQIVPLSVNRDPVDPSFGAGLVNAKIQAAAIAVHIRFFFVLRPCTADRARLLGRTAISYELEYAIRVPVFCGWRRILAAFVGHKNGVSYSNQVGNAVFMGYLEEESGGPKRTELRTFRWDVIL